MIPAENSAVSNAPTSMGPATIPDEILHWLALRLVPGLGTKKAGHLVEIFRTPQAIFRASRSELQAAGLSAAVAQSIASGCVFEEAVDQHAKLAACEAELISITDPRYPPRLREIYDPPPVLFARGRVELLQTVMLGVVGTRRPTAYGTAAATRLAKDLAVAGLTIASGMARGIDTAAHKAVLEAEGDTIAVFGCGVDQIYPAENRKLRDQIVEKGLTLSEFPMGTPAYPQNFPVRNRIISGMSAGVLVVEGGEYSGSAITAKLAMEHGREVFAVPGNITSKMSWGPNLLIKQGAKLVQEWNDVAVELKAEDRRRLVDQCRNRLKINGDPQPESAEAIPASIGYRGLNPVARTVFQALKPDVPVALDQLMETIPGASSSEIFAVLFELELAGLVRQVPGKNFVRVWAD
jgi:DNA processing protein